MSRSKKPGDCHMCSVIRASAWHRWRAMQWQTNLMSDRRRHSSEPPAPVVPEAPTTPRCTTYAFAYRSLELFALFKFHCDICRQPLPMKRCPLMSLRMSSNCPRLKDQGRGGAASASSTTEPETPLHCPFESTTRRAHCMWSIVGGREVHEVIF